MELLRLCEERPMSYRSVGAAIKCWITKRLTEYSGRRPAECWHFVYRLQGINIIAARFSGLFTCAVYRNSGRRHYGHLPLETDMYQFVPHREQFASIERTGLDMLYREIIAVCSQIHTEHINTLCGQNVELYIKIQSVPRSKHTPSRLYKPVS